MMSDRPGIYDGEVIAVPPMRLTPEEQLALLDWHPIFTGRCPECEVAIKARSQRLVRWECDRCGWVDERV